MPCLSNRLSAKQIDHLTERGWYADGRGLYLQVSAAGTKSWVYRYTFNGKPRWHGLGAATRLNSLKQARLAAERCRQKTHEGIDPIEARESRLAEEKLEAARQMSFSECASAYIDIHRHGWRNQKHQTQWRNTLTHYAFPVIGDRAVQLITVADVLQIVEPIWHQKTETANRVRQRIELILDWATARGYREGANPAQWRGHMDKLLPRPKKVRAVKHHAALAIDEMPGFYRSLTEINTTASRSLRWLILTAARSREARDATWDEIDNHKGIWTLPGARMKSGMTHRVPLGTDALQLLDQNKPQDVVLLFPGASSLRPITDTAVRKLVQQHQPGITIHGFRSTFRDWCAERTTFSRELAEKALSHSLSSATESAYQRTDLLDARRALMTAWAEFCQSDLSH
jgi:integrase